jgi:hypothetical protein
MYGLGITTIASLLGSGSRGARARQIIHEKWSMMEGDVAAYAPGTAKRLPATKSIEIASDIPAMSDLIPVTRHGRVMPSAALSETPPNTDSGIRIQEDRRRNGRRAAFVVNRR